MNGGGREWRLHLGAHKTATTHLQALLVALRPELEAAGTGVATIEQIRPVRAVDLRLRRPSTWIAGPRLAGEIETRLSVQVTLLPRMVLSEEDMLGDALDTIRPRPYPRAAIRVRALASALLRRGQGGLWLSVRSLDRFVPAAYATALKHGVPGMDAATLRRRTLADPPDWSALVARLRRAAPGVPITVWDYADYRENARAILQSLTGTTVSHLPALPDPPETQTPDAAAIAAAEGLSRRLDPRERMRRVGAIYDAARGPRFALFSPEESAGLQTLHRDQVAALTRIDGVRLLRF